MYLVQEIVRSTSHQYSLLSGGARREFVRLLADEVVKLSRGEVKLSCLVVFLVVLLQRDVMVKKNRGY